MMLLGVLHMNANPPQSDPLIFGLANIGEVFGKSRWTIRRWIEHQGFPAAKLPDGHWVTDRELIRRWILVRRDYSIPKAGQPGN